MLQQQHQYPEQEVRRIGCTVTINILIQTTEGKTIRGSGTTTTLIPATESKTIWGTVTATTPIPKTETSKTIGGSLLVNTRHWLAYLTENEFNKHQNTSTSDPPIKEMYTKKQTMQHNKTKQQ